MTSETLENPRILLRNAVSAFLLLLCAGASADSSSAQERAPAWHAFLWLDGDSEAAPELFDAIRALGFHGTNVAGTASSDLHGAAGLPFYVDHVAGKGWLYLDDAAWARCREGYRIGRERRFLARPRSLFEPEWRAGVEGRMDEVLDKALPNRPLALSLDDEISLARRGGAFDFDHSEGALEAFRRAMRERHGSPEALARAWGTEPVPFEDLVPLTTDALRARELAKAPSSWNLRPWCEFRAFMDEAYSGEVLRLARRVRDRAPGVPVGFTGGGQPGAFSGLDWWTLARGCDLLEPYDVGGTRALVGSWASHDALILRTIFPDARGPQFEIRSLHDGLLRGDRGAIVWAASGILENGDPKRPTDRARALAPTLRRFGGPEIAEWLAARPVAPEVVLVESQASVRVHWMLDSRRDGLSWIERLDSFERENSSQARNREAWHLLLDDLAVPYRHVAARALEEDPLEGVKVLVLPRVVALSDAEAAAIRRFAARGTVIADAQLGVYDEWGKARKRPALDDLFGLARRDREVALEGPEPRGPRPRDEPDLVVAEPGLRALRDSVALLTVDEAPALLERRTGDGLCAYLNLFLLEYPERRRLGRPGALPGHVRALLARAGVVPAIRTDSPAAPPWPLRVHVRRRGAATYLGLLPNWSSTTVETTPPAAGAISFSLRLPERARVRTLLGAPPTDPRPTRELRVAIDPYEAAIFRLDRTR